MKSVNIFLVNRNDMTTAGNNDENAENAENVANVEVVEFVTDVVENAAIAESPAKKNETCNYNSGSTPRIFKPSALKKHAAIKSSSCCSNSGLS